MEPKSVKEALTDPAWIESMQEELHQFIRLDVWELVPSPDGIKPLTLKWLFKNKHDEENTVIRNKTRLVVKGYRQEEGQPSVVPRVIPAALVPVVQNLQAPTASMSFQDLAPIPTNSLNTPVSSHNVDGPSQQHAHQQRNLT
nr:Gag-Pol polyprotein [Tanacetum cinerariifolium]